MENKFPYKGNIVTVSKDMCDMNGHMNVAFYSKIFDEGSGSLYQDLGFSWDEQTIRETYSTFTLEENIRYVKENVNRKIIHHASILLNEKKELSAISECLLIHIDMKLRKSAPMPDETFERVNKLKEKHEALGPLDFELRLKIKN